MFEQMLNNDFIKAQEPEKLKINGEFYYGYLMGKEEFIKMFNELNTLIKSDDEKYWILYDEVNQDTRFYEEIYCCIPTEEISFINEDGNWYLFEVTIEEDDDENCEELEKFEKFESNLACYVLYDKRADVEAFKLWKAFDNFINEAKDQDTMLDNKVCLIAWLEDNWNAFLKCILDDNFKYINVSSMVLESWEEFYK